jgi:hypothetical protein
MTEDQRTTLIVQTATTIYVALLTAPQYAASPPDKQFDRAMKRARALVSAAESGGGAVETLEEQAAPPTPSPGIPQPPRKVSMAEAIAAGPAPLPDQPTLPAAPAPAAPPVPHVHESDEELITKAIA